MTRSADDAPEDSGHAPTTEGPARGGTLWRQIADDIEAEIKAGVYAGGRPLPTVVALAERFGVNRHTVRQSLQFLQMHGVVSVEQGRGTFVRARRFDYRLERRVRFRDNFGETDIALAGEIVSIGIEPVGGIDGALLRLPPATAAWTFTIVRNVEGAPLSMSLHRLCAADFPDFDRILDPSAPSVTDAFLHFGIGDYVRLSTRVSASLPTPGERAILQLGQEEPVLRTRGLDGLPDGRPFHLTTTAFVAERIEFVVEPASTPVTGSP